MNNGRVVIIAALSALPSSAQAADANWSATRTEYAYPDLQGQWVNSSLTPFLRLNNLGTR
ncbi:MAG: hypothetical protein OXE78_12005 [Gammaproteobacteria bacterium]|nr:hypothetical protein [Gammaproteobacteria bacterium]MCY4356282.1 hypothetical protein [Gammaproteobacteria bacterium]